MTIHTPRLQPSIQSLLKGFVAGHPRGFFAEGVSRKEGGRQKFLLSPVYAETKNS
ncbi:hypothetical protein [Dryocola sp. BD626]|uniref:hypothetical protein n=1 Tax=Dryocola sp. BD626 TaxID=3133273 RepID=UPI003F500BA3